MSFQQAAVAALATADRVLGAASDRKSQAKYDRDILHIIEQYPGCSEARVLDFLRARVHWFGRGTSIDSVFRPSLGTVHAAGRRLETARKINSKVDHAEHHPLLRFFPNTRIWADTECREPGLPPRLRLSDMGEGAGGRSAVRLSA